ncbi:hypothetical protein DPMN_108232 [Dreissena polymorpha]|uniref:Uncharacterized protein n=1 Tax=Dreissena polymorpha TaxID=45954 RepID=A0A9D4QKZ4_DREPO|nr:hypothetical protein DPMN_108232 [Dreissena polymorpha]
MFKTIFAVMILIGRTPNATCQTAADVKALRTKLFTTNGYEPRVRPIDDQSLPIGRRMEAGHCLEEFQS